VSYRSDQYANIGGSRGLIPPFNSRLSFPLGDTFRIQAYGLLDLRAGIGSIDGTWSVELFAKNVTDRYYTTNILTSYDNVVRYAGMPRTYGLTVRYKHL